jgi:hypothetical protein
VCACVNECVRVRGRRGRRGRHSEEGLQEREEGEEEGEGGGAGSSVFSRQLAMRASKRRRTTSVAMLGNDASSMCANTPGSTSVWWLASRMTFSPACVSGRWVGRVASWAPWRRLPLRAVSAMRAPHAHGTARTGLQPRVHLRPALGVAQHRVLKVGERADVALPERVVVVRLEQALVEGREREWINELVEHGVADGGLDLRPCIADPPCER